MYNPNDGLFAGVISFSVGQEAIAAIVWYATFIAIAIVSYLLGSVNTAIIVSKTMYKDDIRKHGSGNGGLTNMHRTFGLKAAGLTLLGDMLKTALAIFVTGTLLGFFYTHGISGYIGYCYMSALFVVLGHIFPIYYGFKGGKGVLVTAVAALILTPIPFAILLLLFIAIVWVSGYISLGSVSAAVLYPVVISGYFNVLGMPTEGITSLSTIIIAILIVWCHRENLKRISNRTERKFSFKKKPEIQLEKKDESEDEE